MRKLLSDRTPAVAGALCLVLAAGLSGCASRNPLMDEPAEASAAPKAETKSAGKANPAEAANTANTAAADSGAGVKTVEPTAFQRFINLLKPYRVDVQQGNFVSRETVAQLKEGMQRKEGVTPDQVRFVLGTPLLNDIFHADRWDYLFRLQKRNGEVISSRVTVFFKDGRLARIEGDQLPTEEEYLKYIAGDPANAK